MSSVLLKPKPKSKRILELDALRAISCLNLLLFHFTYVYANKYGFETPLGFAFPYGKYGVQLFFMLSGFVNAMTFVGKRSAKDFLFARAIRIFPSYWLVILLNVFLLSQLPLFHTPTASETVANLTTMPRLFGFENLEPVTWTLQIEMLFYGTLVIMMLTGAFEKMLRNLMIMVGVCLVFCLAASGFKSAFPDSGANQFFWGCGERVLHAKHASICHGHVAKRDQKQTRNRVAECRWYSGRRHRLSCDRLTRSQSCGNHVVVWVVDCLCVGQGSSAAIQTITVYQFHLLHIVFIPQQRWFHLYPLFGNDGNGPLLAIVIVTVLSIGLGTATTIWFEQPITKFLRHWWKQRKEELSTSPQTPPTASSNN